MGGYQLVSMKGVLNNKFIALLKLARMENLVMIAFTMYLLRYFVIQKILISSGMELGLNDRFFGVLVFSTVLIAAAGYIINDYFDVKTDLINHPDTVVLDKVLSRRVAIILHLLFTVTGVVLGVMCALKVGYLRLSIFHFSAAVLLWFYSTHFKKQLLVGNIVVSLLSSAVAFIPLVYEMGVMQHLDPSFTREHLTVILKCFKVTLLFAVFAFITTMAREIIKDLEDIDGDRATGARTLPIQWGVGSGKLTAFFLLLITVLLLLFVEYNTLKAFRDLMAKDVLYILFALILPLIFLMLMVLWADEPVRFRRASLLLKLIMLFGLGFSVIFFYS